MASVMVLTNGLSSFQHCQYVGTSRCTSEIRTNEPSAKWGAARLSGNIPHPKPATGHFFRIPRESYELG
jgi:hypothetical protein